MYLAIKCQQSVAIPGLNLLPITPAIAAESAALPSGFHGDPADRIIAATTRINDLTLITKDSKIISYAENGHLNFLRL